MLSARKRIDKFSNTQPAVGVVHHSRSGMASGINNTFRQVGVATGVAGLGAIFQHDVVHKTTAALHSLPGGAQVLAASGSVATNPWDSTVGRIRRTTVTMTDAPTRTSSAGKARSQSSRTSVVCVRV